MKLRSAGARCAAILCACTLLSSCLPGRQPGTGSGRAASGAPAGNPAAVGQPGDFRRIASLAPACTSILSGLGAAASIVAIDDWSSGIPGVPREALRLDMLHPDIERLAALEPDLLLVSTLTQEGTNRDPFKPLADSGIRVVYIPTATSIEDIRRDTATIAALTRREREGDALLATMDRGIEEVREIARSIPAKERRTVLFEIAPAPYIYSFGQGVYLDELLSAAGAVNVFAGESGWIAVSGEHAVASNPDVILTNVNYLDDPVGEILSRDGWSGVPAVRDGRVYRIDSATSSQPTPDVVRALRQIAEAVYPEYFN